MSPRSEALMYAPVSRRTRTLTTSAACVALFLIFLDNTVVNVALPTIQRRLGSAPDQLEWSVSAYVVAFAGLVLLAGRLGDRFGTRRLFILGLLIFAAASVIAALANGSGVLIAARAAQGVGAALLAPLSLSLLTRVVPPDQLPVVVGVWAGVSGLGLAIGPLVGGLLVEHSGWQAIFWLNVPLCLLAFGLTRSGVPQDRGRTDRLDLAGSALVTGGLVAGVAGLVNALHHAWTSALTLGLLTTSAVLLTAFMSQQAANRHPLIPRAWRSNPAIRSATVVLALASFALFGTLWFLALYLQNIRGYSAIEAGVRTLPLTLSTLFVAPLTGKITARRGSTGPLIVGLLLTAAATASLSSVTTDTRYFVVAATLVALGTGLAIVMPTAVSVVLDHADHDQAGTAAGLVIMARQFGGAIGLAALGTIGSRVAASRFVDTTGVHGLSQTIAGGQTALLAKLRGDGAAAAAAGAFVHGFSVAMWIATAACVCALAIVIRNRSVYDAERRQALPAGTTVAPTPRSAPEAAPVTSRP